MASRFPIIRLMLISSAVCLTIVVDAEEFQPIAGISSITSGTDLWPASNLIQGPGIGFEATEPHSKTLTGAEGHWVTAALQCDSNREGFPRQSEDG